MKKRITVAISIIFVISAMLLSNVFAPKTKAYAIDLPPSPPGSIVVRF